MHAPDTPRSPTATASSAKIDEVLALVSDRPLRQNFLQLSRRHQAAGKSQRAENHFHRKHRHHERRHVRRAQIKFRRAHQRDAKRAERVAQRRPLRHGRHLHQAQRHADDRAQHQRDGDPSCSRRCRGAAACRRSPAACPASPARTPRRAVAGELIHFSDKNEKRRGDQISDLDEGVLCAGHAVMVSSGRWS